MRKITVALFVAVLAAFGWAEDVVNPVAGDRFIEAVATADEMSWWTVDSGGGASNGGTFTLEGTIGQPESGVASHLGFAFSGGHWSGVENGEYVFSDDFESGDCSFWSSAVGESR